jgi:hypothetical protein
MQPLFCAGALSPGLVNEPRGLATVLPTSLPSRVAGGVRGLRIQSWIVALVGISLTAGVSPSDALAVQDPAATTDRGAWVSPGVPHPGSDQIWWVPTFAQAQEVASATGRLILVMGSVSDWRDGY